MTGNIDVANLMKHANYYGKENNAWLIVPGHIYTA